MQKQQKPKGDLIRFFSMWLILIIAAIGISFIPPIKDEPKKLKFEFSIDETNAILYCLDKSNAEHTTVTAVSKLITDQANVQLAAEKKIADSLNKIPPKKN